MFRKLLATVAVAITALVALGGAPVPASAASSGTLTVHLTQPVDISGTGPAQLTCSSTRTTYTITSRTATVDGYHVSASMVVFKYKGAGSYMATMTLSVKAIDGSYKATGAITGVPVTINSTGGTWNFSKVASGAKYPKLAGKTIAGTISWTCPTA